MTRTIDRTVLRTVLVVVLGAVLLMVGVGAAWADAVRPTVTGSFSPATPNGDNGWYTSVPTFSIDATSSEGTTIAAVYCEYDATTTANWVTYPGPFSASLEGTHTIYYYAVDVNGATSTIGSSPYLLDTVKPVIGDVTPAITNNRFGALRATATDTLSGIFGGVMGGPWGKTPASWSHSSFDAITGVITVMPVSPLVSGENVVVFWAEDKAGNFMYRAEIVTLDVTPPVVHDNHKASYIGSAGVKLWATDTTGTGVASISYGLDGATQTVSSNTVTVHTGVVGMHTLTYLATDNAGNASAPVTVTFRVFATPAITILSGPSSVRAGYAFRLSGRVNPPNAYIQITRYHYQHGKWVSAGRYNLYGRADGTWMANVSARFLTPGSWKYIARSGGASATWYVTAH